jgi:transcriptional regulator with XRE-family HTH domain
MNTLENLRYHVKRLRLAKGLSQEALAEKAKLEYKHYQRIESGAFKGIQLRTIEALAEALDVLPCILICPTDKKIPLKKPTNHTALRISLFRACQRPSQRLLSV